MARRNVIQFAVEIKDRVSPRLNTIQAKMAAFAKRVAANGKVIALAFAGAAFAFTRFIDSVTKAFDDLQKLSVYTGASAERLSELGFAAERSGVSINTLNVGIRGLVRNTNDAAQGIGEALEAFKELNINATDLNKLEFDKQLLVLAEAFSKVESGTRRMSIAQDIFGGRAAELIKLFDKGAIGVQEYAREVRNLGGTVTTQAAESSAKYRDALTNLGAAFTGLKVALVESGLVDAMTRFVNEWARLISIATGSNIGALIQSTQNQIDALKNSIEKIEESGKKGPFGGNRLLDDLKKKLNAANVELERLLTLQGEYLLQQQEAIAAANSVGGAGEEFGTFAELDLDRLQKFQEIQVRAFRQGQGETRPDSIIQIDNELAQVEKRWERIAEIAAEKTRFMQGLADEAARSIQSAFSDFFFDPFEDGLKGMVKSFIDAIRRMIAEWLAFQTVTALGIPGFFSGAVGLRAGGGPVAAGSPYIVGERGPELFIPGKSGSIVPGLPGGMGGMNFVTNIDARGADPGLIARLPQIMEQRDRRLMLKMKDYLETGGLSL